MNISPIVPTYCNSLSVRVAKILDSIGASEEIRQHSIQTAVTSEILLTYLQRQIFGISASCYIFGSSSEGTTTLGLHSDVDRLISKDNWRVVQDESGLRPQEPVSLLMVTDVITRPGYTKLQVALEGKLQSDIVPDIGIPPNEISLDNERRVVISKRYYIASMEDEIHGPAFTIPAREGYAAIDMVQAYRGHRWPDSAYPWFKRITGCEWPSTKVVEAIKPYGFFVVPVGHTLSPENDKEWRISLSLQERVLVRSFNDTQYKCYILLKMIKKGVLPHLVKGESVTSYHLKTCLFYMIENTPASLWTPDKLLACLQGCLHCLLQWAVSGKCPNYFIPEENMFEGRIQKNVLNQLQRALAKLVKADYQYLIQIKSDEFGDYLTALCLNTIHAPTNKYQAEIMKLNLDQRPCSHAMMIRNLVLKDAASQMAQASPFLLATVEEMRKLDSVTEHTKQETIMALVMVLPYLELSLMSVVFVNHATNNSDKASLWKYIASNMWYEIREVSDVLSARLKQATFMYMVGFKDEAFEILDYLLEAVSLTSYVVSVCHCRKKAAPGGPPEVVMKTVREQDFYDFISNNTAPCVVFLPDEKWLMPEALVYEMYRSTGMPDDTRSELLEYWYDWAVVDGKFLLYFLLYLYYTEFDFGLGPVYIMFMEILLLHDSDLGHRETALNLLGWIHRRAGNTNEALRCFKRSLDIQPLHNAAVWHVCVTLYLEIKQLLPNTE